jgi:hypothetical protein
MVWCLVKYRHKFTFITFHILNVSLEDYCHTNLLSMAILTVHEIQYDTWFEWSIYSFILV